ncbi:MAG: DUF1538 domain-containing protein [Christensenellales bacterium]
MNEFWKKGSEALLSALPVIGAVVLLHFIAVPLPGYTFYAFIFGAVLLVIGTHLFTFGTDIAMMPMGEAMGAKMTERRRLGLLVVATFIMGVMITIAEPDLQVLAGQVSSVPSMVLILCVALGVGVFLVVSLLRIVLQVKLAYCLWGLYILVFLVAIFVPANYLPVAFDSGGVTTGPITVPFILALGTGVASVRGKRSSQDDSFGLVAIASVGPILAIMILSAFYGADSSGYAAPAPEVARNMNDVFRLLGADFVHRLSEMALALAPIVLSFAVFQIFFLKLPKRRIGKMAVGVLYTYLGLVLFMTGVNVGFLPVGSYLGGVLAVMNPWVLIGFGFVIGAFVVAAEPAVHVLNQQVYDISVGAVSKLSMLTALSLGVGTSVALAMLRIVTGLSIWWIIVPGYAIALVLMRFVPQNFTAIAFDSGGVASGAMTATFLLPFAMGAAQALGGDIMLDAFGLVAFVAMTPLITIQIMGLLYEARRRKAQLSVVPMPEADDEIIEFEEEEQDE